MNPLFAAVLAALLRRKRTCPSCRRSQEVPADRRREAVSCRFCGASIPPRVADSAAGPG